MLKPYRPEYPRPQFVRESWCNLNGQWAFAFDTADEGCRSGWFVPGLTPSPFDLTINVPFVYQSRLSGIGERTAHNMMWYQRPFTVPADWRQSGKSVLLNCGAADYRTAVWVNGQFAGEHEGGHTPFQLDITPYLADQNSLVLRVEDILTDLTQPRGKQFWQEQSAGIFYTPSSGIWQTVWLESAPALRLEGVQFTPDVAGQAVQILCYANKAAAASVEVEISFEGALAATAEIALVDGCGTAVVPLPEPYLWSPESPHCYDVALRLAAPGQPADRVQSYFGMRSMDVRNGRVELNGAPYVMKLVLDQGYYPDGLLTAPSDDAIRRDVELVKAMGFNGVRKHQKVEDPRYLYWADRLGLLVWGEMANTYRFSPTAAQRLITEWQAVIERDYNHPCIVAWVPVNESWGVPELRRDPAQVQFLLGLYHLTKALDPTRLVISNDGWEHTRSDLCTIHDYTGEAETVAARYARLEDMLAYCPSERPIYAPGHAFEGQPILVSECGGIAYRTGEEKGWGYTEAGSATDLETGYRQLVTALLNAPLLQGFCYTQLTDVEQEINGLLTYDRQPKLPLATIRAINEGMGEALDLAVEIRP
ncbi:MAG: glycoside hydrolase family 2 [Ardenticatenaceae bacterium]|nr:glycoside hydrolase family 2 [Ardenticatenaceae bacterium]